MKKVRLALAVAAIILVLLCMAAVAIPFGLWPMYEKAMEEQRYADCISENAKDFPGEPNSPYSMSLEAYCEVSWQEVLKEIMPGYPPEKTLQEQLQEGIGKFNAFWSWALFVVIYGAAAHTFRLW
jgi:hypothetical protein